MTGDCFYAVRRPVFNLAAPPATARSAGARRAAASGETGLALAEGLLSLVKLPQPGHGFGDGRRLQRGVDAARCRQVAVARGRAIWQPAGGQGFQNAQHAAGVMLQLKHQPEAGVLQVGWHHFPAIKEPVQKSAAPKHAGRHRRGHPILEGGCQGRHLLQILLPGTAVAQHVGMHQAAAGTGQADVVTAHAHQHALDRQAHKICVVVVADKDGEKDGQRDGQWRQGSHWIGLSCVSEVSGAGLRTGPPRGGWWLAGRIRHGFAQTSGPIPQVTHPPAFFSANGAAAR